MCVKGELCIRQCRMHKVYSQRSVEGPADGRMRNLRNTSNL